MVSNESDKKYIFLDGEHERKQLCIAIKQVREAVTSIVQALPEDQWYEPRYHGWTPAAMLGHLNLIDSLSMLTIKLALIGPKPKVSMQTVDRLNGFTSRLFRKRLVTTTIEGIHKKQESICDFILNLPINRFSTQVYDPVEAKYITVEKALQARFLHHWQSHLETIQQVEGIEQPPEEHSDSV